LRVAVTSIPRFAREVYFSPNGGRTDAIVRELDKAQSTVLVQAYSSSSYKIAKALLDVHKRGIKVEIFFHKNQKRLYQGERGERC
jgi:phosphatidylserine/phosphatidylglycerophosphate/cardiolipin synthase-like enzyme